jgi:hypothetical protein
MSIPPPSPLPSGTTTKVHALRIILQNFCMLEIFVLTPWEDSETDVYVAVIENLEAAMIAARNAMLDKGWTPDPKSYTARPFLGAALTSRHSTSHAAHHPTRSASRKGHTSAAAAAGSKVHQTHSDEECEDEVDEAEDPEGSEKEQEEDEGIAGDEEKADTAPPAKKQSHSAKVAPSVHFLYHPMLRYLSKQEYEITKVNQAQALSKRVWTDKHKRRWTWDDALDDSKLATAIMTWQMNHHLQLRTMAVAATVCTASSLLWWAHFYSLHLAHRSIS